MVSITTREQKLWAVQAEVNNFLITCHRSIYFERLELSWGFYKDNTQQWKYTRIVRYIIAPMESTVDRLLIKTWLFLDNIKCINLTLKLKENYVVSQNISFNFLFDLWLKKSIFATDFPNI